MIHDSGHRGRAAAPDAGQVPRGADLVVFGHSHIPLDAADGALRIFNPGSPTDRRRQPHGTLGVLHDRGRRPRRGPDRRGQLVARPDQTRFIERTVTASPQLDVLSMA